MRLAIALGVGGLPLAENADLARRAERAGFDTVCAGEFGYDSFVVAALLAAATRQARVMTAVTTWARPPAVTAAAAVTVAELAEGRFVLGLGTMPALRNRDWYGIDPAHPLARMGEYVEGVRRCVVASREQPAEFAGRFFRICDYAPRSRRSDVGRVAVHLAATLPGMARLAGEIADGVLVNVVHTIDWLRDVLLPALTEGELAGGGARQQRAVMVRCVPHGTRGREVDAARRLSQDSLRRYQGIDYFDRVVRHSGWSAAEITDEMADAMCVTGTPDEIRSRLAAYEPWVDMVELAPVVEQSAEGLRRSYELLFEVGESW